jgi:Secretory lipase
MRALAVYALPAVAALLLGGCAPAPNAHHTAPTGAPMRGDFSGSGPGTLIAAETLPQLDPLLRAETSLAARITYVSSSGVNDEHPQVTGTVFVPAGEPPPGGWRIVAVGHPMTGIQTECAPSASPTLLGSAPVIAALVGAGFMVAMTDYQGLGSAAAYHPFLDSSTEGYNLIDSVRAARRLVPAASDAWVAYGRDQGGQAAWAANELAADYNDGLRLIGAIAVAPLAALDGLADGAAAGTLNRDQQLVLQQYLQALHEEYGDFDLDAYRHGIAKDHWDELSACWGPQFAARTALAAALGPGDLRPEGQETGDTLAGYLKKTSLPQGRTAAPMLVAAGPDGDLLPTDWTAAALRRSCGLGDVIQVGAPIGDDQTPVIEWINARFDADPATNDCPAPSYPSQPVGG